MYSPPDLKEYSLLSVPRRFACPLCHSHAEAYEVKLREGKPSLYVITCSGETIISDTIHPFLTEPLRCPMEFPPRPFYQENFDNAIDVWTEFFTATKALQKKVLV